ncbi:hypothetical protein ACFVP0_09990 [Streptomyces cinereoruber]|uniref:hypothetical protein n=1 Tax=Streptomyces cinereoruber TaxID=67260 RepID=UPI0036916312
MKASTYRWWMMSVDREAEEALDTVRDRYGRIVRPEEAAEIRVRRTEAALKGYRTDLAGAALPLLDVARRALDTMPPVAHVRAWRDVLDSLAVSHTEILRLADLPAEHGRQALWPHLARWAEHGTIAVYLADQHHHQPGLEFTADESREWTRRARAAQDRGELDLIESWYAADGRRITLAYLVEDDASEVIALAGDPGAPLWSVIGRYDNELAAGRVLPLPVPPGVLHPEGPGRFTRPEPAPEVPVQVLLRDVAEAHCVGDVSEALFTATDWGTRAGPMTHLQQLVNDAAEFSHALESEQGRSLGARLGALGRQLGLLADEIRDTAGELGKTVAVLPPHRVPKLPRRPVLETSLPPAAPQRTAPSARRS